MNKGAWGDYSPWGYEEMDVTEHNTHTQVKKPEKNIYILYT